MAVSEFVLKLYYALLVGVIWPVSERKEAVKPLYRLCRKEACENQKTRALVPLVHQRIKNMFDSLSLVSTLVNIFQKYSWSWWVSISEDV